MRRLSVLLAIAIMVGMMLGGAWSQAEAHPVILIKGTDHAFDAPATVRAGFVALEFVNSGAEPHHAQLARLNDGVTLQRFQEALQKGPEAALPLVTLVGGPATVAPGGRQRVSLELLAGDYVLLCFVTSADGIPHLAKGMIRPLRVTGAVTARVGLRTSGEIAMTDFAFALPRGFTGKGIYRVVNKGVQPHEIGILRLAPGKTVEDLKTFFAQPAPAGPPPFIPAGGAQAFGRSRVNYLHLNLTSGTYVAVCFVPDPASGKPHTALGMITTFQVK